jgi:Domain of unknown function (DUF4157)
MTTPVSSHTNAPTEAAKAQPQGAAQRCACGGVAGPTGECGACQRRRQAQEGTLQRQASGPERGGDLPPIVHDVLSMPGQPLDAATQAFMEPRFGQDFSGVRVHTGVAAAASASAVQAHAYTVGNHVVFGADEYRPHATEGQRLLAHELTHVVHQGGGGRTPLRGANTSHEQEAERVSQNFLSSIASPLQVNERTGAGLAASGPPRPPALSVGELFDFLLSQMGHASAPPGPPLQDPSGVGAGVGPARTPGYQVHAALQVIDPQGGQVLSSYGAYMGGGGPHGEEQAIQNLRLHLPTDGSLRGGRLMVAVTQDPCGPDRHDCAAQLRKLARDYGLELDSYVPDRSAVRGTGGVRPPTAARSAQRLDRPPVEYRRLESESKIAASAPANDNAIPPKLAPANDNAIPPKLTPANDNAIPPKLTPANDNAIPPKLTPANDNAIPPKLTPGRAGALSDVAGIALGFAAELIISIGIGLFVAWLIGLLEEAMIKSQLEDATPEIKNSLAKLSSEITRIQEKGKVYARISVEVRHKHGVASGEGQIVGWSAYNGASFLGLSVEDAFRTEEKREFEVKSTEGQTITHDILTYSVLIDDPQKRMRDREQTELADKLNRLNAQRQAATPKPSSPPPPTRQDSLPSLLPGPTQPPPQFLPGAPGEGPLEQATRWAQGAEVVGWQLVSQGNGLETRQGTNGPSPSKEERETFLKDEAQWRLAVQYQLNWSIDHAPELAAQRLKQLLQDPAKPGPKLDTLRVHLGG